MSELELRPAAYRAPVADYIEEEMLERGWSVSDLAVRMGGDSPSDVGRDQLAIELLFACRNERNIRLGEETALRLGRAFDVSPELFRNLEKSWIEWKSTEATHVSDGQ
jgi:plasmid maintenance system antidote protein VapI